LDVFPALIVSLGKMGNWIHMSNHVFQMLMVKYDMCVVFYSNSLGGSFRGGFYQRGCTGSPIPLCSLTSQDGQLPTRRHTQW
jgi:hypothetical protein